ncbi:MAG TPA: hypothetical protein VGG13_00820 [Candidatus Saccharimonadales bacterium]|jgi:NADH pyrophosphatase NudC (nudix superfamily)
MEKLLKQLSRDYPAIQFVAAQSFYWSPATRQVFYNSKTSANDTWSIVHELAHALLGHTAYSQDIELLQLEVAAWKKAEEIGKRYGIEIDSEHIEDCLDSYRDWLYKRSICPSCGTKSIQQDEVPQYQCFNCHDTWCVTPSRFCRPYRQCDGHEKSSATFAVADDSLTLKL